MNGSEYPSIEEAIYRTVHHAGMDLKVLGPEVGYLPNNLSQRATLYGNPQFPFPAGEKLVKLQTITQDFSVLYTMAALLGQDRPHPKRDHLPEILDSIARKQADLQKTFEQLKIMVPLVDSAPARGKR